VGLPSNLFAAYEDLIILAAGIYGQTPYFRPETADFCLCLFNIFFRILLKTIQQIFTMCL